VHIFIVNHYALTPTEPGATRHFSLAKTLVERGHQVTIFAAGFHHLARESGPGPVTREMTDGVAFVRLPTPPYQGNGIGRVRNMIAFARSIGQLVRQTSFGRPDVVLGSSPTPFAALAARKVARHFGVPFVLEIRDLWPDSLIDVAGVPRWHPFVLALRLIERTLYRGADAIVTLLPDAGAHIVAEGGHPERIVHVPNGVDLSLVMPWSPPTPGRPFTIMYAGTMGVANALHIVLEAAQVLERDHSAQPVRFRLVGAGPEKQALVQRALDMGLHSVSFEDPIPKSDVHGRLAESDVCLLNLKDSPVFARGLSPNKLFDYMAVGRPILMAVNTPTDPVTAANAGLVIPPEDPMAMAAAIRALAAMPTEEREAMGRRGRAYVEKNHDMRVLANRLLRTCERVFEERSIPGWVPGGASIINRGRA
jgi:glycosyltransferase involved in cell wall biosynthesis